MDWKGCCLQGCTSCTNLRTVALLCSLDKRQRALNSRASRTVAYKPYHEHTLKHHWNYGLGPCWIRLVPAPDDQGSMHLSQIKEKACCLSRHLPIAKNFQIAKNGYQERASMDLSSNCAKGWQLSCQPSPVRNLVAKGTALPLRPLHPNSAYMAG